MAHGDDLGLILRTRVQAFVRAFGLLRDAETPCGTPLLLSHAHALSVLLELGPEPVRQKDIAKALGLDKSSVARLCKRMEQAGHVSQARDESDGRARAVTLTRAGTRLAREVDAASRARFERVLGALPRPQRRAVVDALGTLNTALEVLEQRELDR